MKVTHTWLKDFVDSKLAPESLAHKLTMAGLEVVSLEHKESDAIYEIEVTSNRPDWLSVVGIAREVAAITGKKLKIGAWGTPRLRSGQAGNGGGPNLNIKVENKKDCPLYTGKIIRGVKVGPSPAWLKERLESIGCRSINNIVDITNYILFSWGEPLHAFDLDKMGEEIIVRRACQGEKIVTIDGQERRLSPDILVIADKEKPVAIAGIMGGKETEVSATTANILLEAAVFDPILIRRSRQKLGLQSDSSYRFERGVDQGAVESSSWRAAQLTQELAGGTLTQGKKAGSSAARKRKISVDPGHIINVLSAPLSLSRIKSILNSLGLTTRVSKNKLTVEVPSHRGDITSQVDVVEEIARIYGYENIPETFPPILPQDIGADSRDRFSLVKNVLVGLGLQEVITYSLINKDTAFGFDAGSCQPIEIANPLSAEQEILRPSLTPSLTSRIAYNLNQKQNYVSIFEIADVYYQSQGKVCERPVVGIALCGTKTFMLSHGAVHEKAGLLHLKGICETLFERLGIISYRYENISAQEIAVYIKDEPLGFLKSYDSAVLEKSDIKHKEAVAAELFFDTLISRADFSRKFSPLPKYPSITRDISLVIQEMKPIQDLLDVIWERAGEYLKDVKVVDYYRGAQIPTGSRGVTISCVYRCDERTLTDEEVNSSCNVTMDALRQMRGVTIR